MRGAGDAAGSSTGLGGPARVNNSAKYESPSLSGVKIGALYGLGELSGSPNDNRTYDIYARYTAGSLDAIISFVDDKISTGTPLNAQTLTVAATYSFGDLRVLGGYLQTDDRSAANADGKGYWVGGEYRFGVHLVRAQYVANDPDAANIDSQVFGVGYQYDLSKRTALYTSVTYFKNEGRARWHGSVPAGLATDTNSDITEFVVGIRHSF